MTASKATGEMPSVANPETIAPAPIPVNDGRYVAAKILKLREKVKTITASKMETGKFSYNYLSENALTNALRPVMQELGLVVIPVSSSIETECYDTGLDRDGNPRKVLLSQAKFYYRIVDTETGDNIEIVSIGAGSDNTDKGVNKASTCAFKNMLRSLGMFPSPERDDPDTHASTSGSNYSGNSSGPGGVLLKYGPHAGKTLQDLFDENPDEVEKLANGKSKWIAEKAQAFLSSLNS